MLVLSEIARIGALPAAERMDRIRTEPHEGFGVLWGHPQWRPLECGWLAKQRFRDIVRFAMKRHADISRNASWNTIEKAVTYAFLDRFLAKGRPLTNDSLNSVIDGACIHVRRKLEDHTLIVPCRLWSQGECDRIPVGPVTFQRASSFFSEEELRFVDCDGNSGKLAEEAATFARAAGWLAIVTLPQVDAEIAALRAAKAIDAAIDVLRVLLGPERMRRCRRAESWGPPKKHSSFRLLPDRSLSVRFTWGGSDDLMWENWSDFVFGGQSEQILAWAGASIHGLTSPQHCLPLQQRFLDALKWYGDAVSESSPAARIAKCVFAWERLVVTGNRASIGTFTQTQLVVNRTAKLCEHVRGAKGVELRKDISELYDIRSRLAHGSQSPWQAEVLYSFSTACEDITARALMGSLRHYLALKQGAGTDKELDASFDVEAL